MRRLFGLARSWWQHPAFDRGLRDMAGVSPGLAAWGLMTGVAMVKSGMSPFEAVAMSLLVFAGSSQLAAMPLIAAGAPLWVIMSTSFCVNLRFVVFSAHMRPYLMHLPLRWRLIQGYLTVDLSYVLFTRHYHHPPTTEPEKREQLAYLSGGSVLNWLSWQGASMVGIALANVIPTRCWAWAARWHLPNCAASPPGWREWQQWWPMPCRSSSILWWPLLVPWPCV